MVRRERAGDPPALLMRDTGALTDGPMRPLHGRVPEWSRSPSGAADLAMSGDFAVQGRQDSNLQPPVLEV